ncbi:MAG: tRNA1(Val) (adenine(37)-N6)-methyltransferase [Bacteroidales bacterium]|jgi:tRNA1Val (adenine37-N6)-methyltransferase|nr:tRNA1(Val) (adenine(37)-N6)-methyltransferase [Bacteroidales bacterium]
MANDYFKFKQFVVYQERCAMKVGTDGVLLGAWAGVENANRILDVGTGTGLIALMLAQRSNASIDALEIDARACAQALENINHSPWAERIHVIHQSFQDFSEKNAAKYDLIVSNPPYFQNSLTTPDARRTQARHNTDLQLDDLIGGTLQCLAPTGTLSLILPYLEGNLLIAGAAEKGLYCVRKTNVLPKPGRKPKRLLLEFQRNKKPLFEQNLVIEVSKRHQYSDDYKALTRDFYLNF